MVTSRAREVDEKQTVLGAQRLGLHEWVQVGPRACQALQPRLLGDGRLLRHRKRLVRVRVRVRVRMRVRMRVRVRVRVKGEW